MKKNYQKPAMRVVQFQYRHQLLADSNKGYAVIGTDPPNTPAGARQHDDWGDE